MGKKHQKKKKTWDHGPENSKKPYPDHPDKAFVHFAHTSPPLEIYYQEVFREYFKDDTEFKAFIQSMKERLPVTFRVNENVPNYKNFLKTLKDPEYIAALLAQGKKPSNPEEETKAEANTGEKIEEKTEKIDLTKEISLRNVSWYPNELVWQMNTFRQHLKKNEALKKLHKYIQRASDSGLITRQELVSMLPPLFLDVQSTDLVFDMCAAPGSKTSQILQTMYRDEAQGKGPTQGGVIANDADYVRAYMLTHQIKRMNAAGIAIVNHHAQYFPGLTVPDAAGQNPHDSKLLFDKILADVPCTGDGAIRKLPNRWSNWAARDGIGLHHLQILILQRALQLAKIGGLIVYSTCSLNPIEDEAVLTDIFRRANPDAFELVDIHSYYPGLIARRGLLNWKVYEETEEFKTYDKERKEKALKRQKNKEGEAPEEEKQFDRQKIFNKYASMAELPKDYAGVIGPTLFPEDEETMKNVYKIQNSMRILPHDQDSGGFFIALLRKKKDVVFSNKYAKGGPTEQQIKEIIKQAEAKEEAEEGENKVKVEVPKEDESGSEAEEEKLPTEPQKNGESKANGESKKSVEVEKAKQPEEGTKAEKTEEKKAENAEGKKEKRNRYTKAKKPEFIRFESPDWKWICEFYGIEESKLKPFTIQLNEGDKNIYLISPAIRKFLDCEPKDALKKLNVGVKLFARNTKESFNEGCCPYRICQDAAPTVFPLLSSKRKIKVTAEFFKQAVKAKNVKLQTVKDAELLKKINEVDSGAVLLYVENDDNIKDFDCVVALKFKASLMLMISTELAESLAIRYIESNVV